MSPTSDRDPGVQRAHRDALRAVAFGQIAARDHPQAHAGVGRVAVIGVGALIPQGFIMRHVMRNSMTPGVEIESVVTQIAEEPAPADAFEIPADYKEVSAPFGRTAAQPR